MVKRLVKSKLKFYSMCSKHGNWSLTLKGEKRLRVFENRVLRRICGPKQEEVTGG
jgi:hypothetical protein